MKFPENPITIGEFKFESKPFLVDSCYHKNIDYDISAKVIRCKDCEREVNHWDAFLALVMSIGRYKSSMEFREEELKELKKRNKYNLLKATQMVDKAWRSRSMIPTCPHCHEAILPADGFGNSQINKELELHKRKFKGRKNA